MLIRLLKILILPILVFMLTVSLISVLITWPIVYIYLAIKYVLFDDYWNPDMAFVFPFLILTFIDKIYD